MILAEAVSMLDRIKIASPCSADWEKMEGNVFNLSAMTRRDAEVLLGKSTGNLCARIERRSDGTAITITKPKRRVGWAIAAGLGCATAWGQDAAVVSGSVRNPDGSFAAKIPLLIKGDSVRIETITDEQGKFGVLDLAPGKYVITVAGETSNVEVKPGAAVEMVIQRPSPANMGEVAMVRRKPWWRKIL